MCIHFVLQFGRSLKVYQNIRSPCYTRTYIRGSQCETDPFIILELQNPSHRVSELHIIRWSSDVEALKLHEDRSNCTIFLQKILFFFLTIKTRLDLYWYATPPSEYNAPGFTYDIKYTETKAEKLTGRENWKHLKKLTQPHHSFILETAGKVTSFTSLRLDFKMSFFLQIF